MDLLHDYSDVIGRVPAKNLKSYIKSRYPAEYIKIASLPGHKFTEKIFRWRHPQYEPKCVVCGSANVKFRSLHFGFRDYCSTKCSNGSDAVKSKKKKSFDETMKHNRSDILEKRKITNNLRYGTDFASQSPKIIEKIKQTNIEKYGTSCTLHADLVKQKVLDGWLKKYGTTIPSLSESVATKTKSTNRQRYGVEYPFQSEAIQQKAATTLYQNHMVTNAGQLRMNEHSRSILSDSEQLRFLHHEQLKSVCGIKTTIGMTSDATIVRYLKYHGIDIKRHFRSSNAENEIAEILNNNNITYERNCRAVIHPYELDFYIKDKRVAIEFCGVYWHSNKWKSKNYHATKYDLCRNLDIHLLTIYESEWCHSRESVIRKILTKLNVSNEPLFSARLCQIRHVSLHDAREFANSHHLQGYVGATTRLGLFYNDQLIGLALLKRNENVLHLTRYCTSGRIRGGFGKIVRWIEQNIDYYAIETFADLRWDSGHLYDVTGFSLIRRIPPDYQYVMGDRTIHKFNLRKDAISRKFQISVDGKTERELTETLGLMRIYDCGKLLFRKMKPNRQET